MPPTKFRFIWLLGFRGEDFLNNQPIRNRTCLWWLYLLMDRDEMSTNYTRPSIDASYKVSVHLATWFQRRRFFRTQPIRNKTCLWWPCLLKDQDEMSTNYRRPSIDASYKVSFHLAKRFQRRRFFRNWLIRKRIACGIHDCKRIGTKEAIFIEDLTWMFPTKCQFIWPSGFREAF